MNSLGEDDGAEKIGYQFDSSSPFSVALRQNHVNDGRLSAAYFGVRMENTADDQTEAFAKMTGWLRNEADTTGRLIELGPYDFNVEGGLDLTNIRCAHGKGFWMIDGRGARVIGRTAGLNAVLDATRSLGGRLSNIAIIGDAENLPRNGLQLARATDGESADFIVLDNVKCDGAFSLAAFYNFASERFAARACLFRNALDAENSYAVVVDGRNKFGALSDFLDVTVPENTPQSCLSHLFVQCSFMRPGSGSTNPLDAIYATRASRVRMVNCYGVGTSGGAVIVFGADNSDIQDIDLDLHVESASLGNAFRFESADGVSNSLTVDNFSWKDNRPYSSDAYLRNEMSGDVTLRGAKIDLGGQHSPAPGNGVFYPKGKFRMRGELRLLTNAAPANIDIARFDGDIHYHNASALTLPTSGSFRVVQNAAGQFHGPFEFKSPGVWPSGGWTAGATFETAGDLEVTYTNQSGTWTKVGDLVFVQVELVFTPVHTTASGALRITGLPFVIKSGSRMHSGLVLHNISAGVTWPSGITSLSVRAPAGQTYLEIRGMGSGTPPTSLGAAHFQSGTAHTISISGVYKANS